MTEREWMTCTGPATMLRFLRSKASSRKMRLFACACVRRVWPLLDRDEQARAVVETVEQFADGLVGKETFDAMLEASLSTVSATDTADTEPLTVRDARSCASTAAWYVECSAYQVWDRTLVTDRTSVLKAATSAAKHVTVAAGASAVAMCRMTKKAKAEAERRAIKAERQAQCLLLHDLFGNPFRSVSFDPAWLSWHDGLTLSMARCMYDTHDFGDMPVLADALEEAGCHDKDILSHCRQQGQVHVRGCWVIDSLLNKN